MAYKILVGSYTNEIFTLEFDPSAPALKVVSSVTVGHHPSWITSYPGDKSIIFAGLEQADGKIVAVKYESNGEAKVISGAASGGADPCSLLATKDELLIGNYSGGTFATLPISLDAPYLLAKEPWVKQFSGSGPNKDRQLSSHIHQVILHPERDELLLPDLGADKVWRFVKGSSGEWELQGFIQHKAGGGPRHVAFYEGILYTLYELTSEVAAHRFPPLPEEPTPLASAQTLSSPPAAPNEMLAAEILIPTPNKTFSTPYLYISNRNDPSPEGDTIAIFSLENPETPTLVTEVRTGLNHVRGIVFGGPDDKWLIAGGVNGGGVKLFERTDGGRDLKLIAATNEGLSAPTGFLWL